MAAEGRTPCPPREDAAGPAGVAPRVTALPGLLPAIVDLISLRTVQYRGEVPLWHDEAAVGRNLDERSMGELVTRPLDYGQMVPVGGLVLLEAGSRLPGSVEIRLRLIPFLVSLLGMVLFWRVARRFLEGPSLLGAVLSFGVAPAMIWYSATVKQYGADVAAAIALVWLALRPRK